MQKAASMADKPFTVHLMFSDRGSLRQALGDEEIDVRSSRKPIDLENGDKVLLTTDGINDNLTDIEIAEIMAGSSPAQMAAERLVAKAKERSLDTGHPRAKPDDITAIVMGEF